MLPFVTFPETVLPTDALRFIPIDELELAIFPIAVIYELAIVRPSKPLLFVILLTTALLLLPTVMPYISLLFAVFPITVFPIPELRYIPKLFVEFTTILLMVELDTLVK